MQSWTRTSSGSPCGCPSRPAFLKSPTSSFFFVSTEITGCLRSWNASTTAVICSHCALRSRWELPSRLSTWLGNSARLPALLGQDFLRYCVAHATEKGYGSYSSDRIVSTRGEVLAW